MREVGEVSGKIYSFFSHEKKVDGSFYGGDMCRISYEHPSKHDSTPKSYLYIQEVCSYFGQTGHTAAFLIMMIFRPARLCSGLNVFILRGV